LVFDNAGNLYGTTMYGGSGTPCIFYAGCGVVFNLVPSSTGQWQESVLNSFFGDARGATMLDASLIFDQVGNLYGTTIRGGSGDIGTVFKLTPTSGGTWKRTNAYVFSIADGVSPNALVLDQSGNIYGAASSGGTSDYGAVFKLAPDSLGSWTRTMLYSFKGGSDGLSPTGLTIDVAGNLYGTASSGGKSSCNGGSGCGVVFKLALNSLGKWTETILYTFSGSDGNQPFGGAVVDTDGNLYGTTFYGGNASSGTVFKLTPSPTGPWTETVLYSFGGYTNDGVFPYAGLAIDGAGNLYGTTTSGGLGYAGTVFKLSPGSNGQWAESILHSFTGYPNDGNYPYASLVLDAIGNVYGTTEFGGSGSCNSFGCGTIFELAPSSGGPWTETILRNFSASGGDGYNPLSGLEFDKAGNLYGQTSFGGSSGCSGFGCGAVFKLLPGSGGQWTETVLHTFTGKPPDGTGGSNLILDTVGNLYGSGGGTANNGIVFQIAP
jgi:uncharacterized repeat protein (TIGR03803 family)